MQIVIALLTNAYWAFPVTRNIYQGPLKVVCSPGLNCYSCPAATTYCPIGALQQTLLSLQFNLEFGRYFFGFYVLGCIGVVGSSVGRIVCGWACPFGLIQELLYKIPSRKRGVPRNLRFVKYGVLLITVVLLPLLVVDEMGLGVPWFCKYICPAGTLEAGLPMLLIKPDLRAAAGFLFSVKLVIMAGFILWSIVASRPFCRTICPLGAFYGLFSKWRLVKLQLDRDRCTNCQECHSVCPMGVKFNESPDDGECITCLKCMKACRYGAINLSMGGIPLCSTDIRVKIDRTQ
ncbi:MAG: 4Fe-4S binding protein [Thermodesulfobacteriota bacterium]